MISTTPSSFIPNTAEVAYFGMLEGLKALQSEQGSTAKTDELTAEEVEKILSKRVRSEKVAIKISSCAHSSRRANRGTGSPRLRHYLRIVEAGKDTLVIIDDSIVRGTTLKQSIIKILDRLDPKDSHCLLFAADSLSRCYGIDMSRMSEFIAFKAAINLLEERGIRHIIQDVYEKCVPRAGRRRRRWSIT